MHGTTFHMMPENEFLTGDFSEESLYQHMDTGSRMMVEEVSNDDVIRDIVTKKTYTNLEANDIKPKKVLQDLFNESTPGNLTSWTHRFPSNWTTSEVMDWLHWTAAEAKLDHSKFQAHLFNRKSGKELCQMNEADFQGFDPLNGSLLYHTLQQLIKKSTEVSSPYDENVSICSTTPVAHTPYIHQEAGLPSEMHGDAHLPRMDCQDEDCSGGMLDLLVCENSLPLPSQENTTAKCVKICGHNYDYDQQDMFCDLIEEVHSPRSTNSSTTSSSTVQVHYDDSDFKMRDVTMDILARQAVLANEPNYMDYDVTSDSCSPVPIRVETIVAKRSPGRPRKNPPAAPKDPNRPKSTRGRKPGQRTKGNHLWEFCRDLLLDPRYNRTHVQWQDRELGVFMIVKSAEVAAMWGQQKKNSSMNYEKMSRSLRFCRKAKYLMEVPKDGRFPKKLCFRFGPLAEGWQIAAAQC